VNTQRTCRALGALCLLMLSARVMASDHDDQPINTASELRDWCKSESEATFIGRGLKPYNWTASYADEGNVLVTKGEWRVDAATVSVVCRVARGAHAEFASMTISP
jgi:lipopolysaccharide export system protein LptA